MFPRPVPCVRDAAHVSYTRAAARKGGRGAAKAPTRGSPFGAHGMAIGSTWLARLPNLITLARLFAVPVVVWAIATGEAAIAFWTFVAAGISDAVDGFLAKRLSLQTALGAYLDPIADKALLVSIYVALGVIGGIPVWLTVLVVARDVLIVGAVILAVVLQRPVPVRPLPVSKVNTGAQIVLAAVVLCDRSFAIGLDTLAALLEWTVAGLTIASAGAYLVDWLGHMGTGGPVDPGA